MRQEVCDKLSCLVWAMAKEIADCNQPSCWIKTVELLVDCKCSILKHVVSKKISHGLRLFVVCLFNSNCLQTK
jgi:thymidine phosphorylase